MDGAAAGSTTGTREPGWHPDRINPNLQKYWDGNAWTAQRRWLSGQWVDESHVGEPPPPSSPSALQATADGPLPFSAPLAPYRSPAIPFGHPRSSAPDRRPAVVSGSLVGVFVSSVIMIIGSFTPWVTVSFANQSAAINGADAATRSLIGLQAGWLTFAGGVLLIVLVMMTMTCTPESIGGFHALTLVAALIALGFAAYDLVRVVQKVSQATGSLSGFVGGPAVPGLSVDVGWGLIVMAVGALGAAFFAVLELKNP